MHILTPPHLKQMNLHHRLTLPLTPPLGGAVGIRKAGIV